MLVTAAPAPAATRLVSGAHVPNEIIVKFRRNVADSIEKTMAESTTGSNPGFPDSLKELNQKYGIRDARKLFKNFRKVKKNTETLWRTPIALSCEGTQRET